MDLNLIWFILLGVLLAGYAILDGFDLGVGMLHLLARGDDERRAFIATIGPVWDGNEVWLVTFGGALFAAFPEAYATIFSGFYFVFMLVLLALIARAVSLDFRSKVESRAWRATWDVADDCDLLIVQHLLLGINAHVNHDLGRVVVELADEHGGELRAMRADFDAVNAVLATTMPEVLADLGRASRWVNRAAAWGADRWFHFSLTTARDQAWRFAVARHQLDAPSRARAAAELDRLVCVLAYLVTRPVRPVRWLVPLARRLEPDDPDAVTRTLLGPLA